MSNVTEIAESILREALSAVPTGAKQLSDADRDALRMAATMLARAAMSSLAGKPPDETERVHLSAIRANLAATGHVLAVRALNDALKAALMRASALLKP